jgi:hypothetical protein
VPTHSNRSLVGNQQPHKRLNLLQKAVSEEERRQNTSVPFPRHMAAAMLNRITFSYGDRLTSCTDQFMLPLHHVCSTASLPIQTSMWE